MKRSWFTKLFGAQSHPNDSLLRNILLTLLLQDRVFVQLHLLTKQSGNDASLMLQGSRKQNYRDTDGNIGDAQPVICIQIQTGWIKLWWSYTCMGRSLEECAGYTGQFQSWRCVIMARCVRLMPKLLERSAEFRVKFTMRSILCICVSANAWRPYAGRCYDVFTAFATGRSWVVVNASAAAGIRGYYSENCGKGS